MSGGVPVLHYQFWHQFTIDDLRLLVSLLNGTPAQLIADIDEPLTMNRAQQRTFGFLISYIGNLNMKSIRLFLRFVTGSAVRIGKDITVEFNSLFGLESQPIVHTCTCTLELPITYSTLIEFTNEFDNVLSDDNVRIMDTI